MRLRNSIAVIIQSGSDFASPKSNIATVSKDIRTAAEGK
jgi:hypothetical protein